MNFWACAFRISWSKMRHLPSLSCSLPDSFFLPVLKNFSETKEDQPWVFIGRTDAEAEIPMLWPPDSKSWLIGKDPDAGKDWGQEEKGTTEDEMAGWHRRHNGHGFGWIPGVGDGQGGLARCGSWGRKELDTTKRLNWTETKDKRKEKGQNKRGPCI